MNNRGQIMIFVAIAIVIVVAIGLFFLIDKKPEILRQGSDNPESFIDGCVKKATLKVIDEMLPRGGFVNPIDYKIYENEKVAYLCKNIRHYEPCVNQYPRLIIKLQEELNEEVKKDVEECFASLDNELTNKNYEVSGGGVSVETTFRPEIVEAKINRDFSIIKGDVVRNFESFNVFVKSDAYNLVYIASEIVDQEAEFCHFSNNGFMALYPSYDIRKTLFGDSTNIYSIINKKTGEKMNLAIRGCVIPAGI